MKVSLFITCLVDQLFPEVGLAVVKLLGRIGVDLTFQREQTCCGQPLFNSGYHKQACEVAERMLKVFERELETSDYLVAPSGSCTTMVKKHYPELFACDPKKFAISRRVSQRFFELTQFLTEVLKIKDVDASFEGRVTYHDCCQLLRELGVSEGPRQLITSVRGVEFVEMDQADACCGFGGTFTLKYPDISLSIADQKITSIEECGAKVLVACDSGCLMQLGGRLKARSSDIRCLHIAELLAMNEFGTNGGDGNK